MNSFTEQITIDAPTDEVWALLSDIGRIDHWNPGVKKSYLTSDQTEGAGTSRRCELDGDNYLDETVVEWRPDEKLTMRITDTNLPFKTVNIHFELSAENGTTLVQLTPKYSMKYGWIGRLLDKLFINRTYRKGMLDLLQGLKERAEKSSS